MVQNIRKRKLSGEKVVDIQKDYSFNIKGIVYNQSWYDKDYVGYKRGGG